MIGFKNELKELDGFEQKKRLNIDRVSRGIHTDGIGGALNPPNTDDDNPGFFGTVGAFFTGIAAVFSGDVKPNPGLDEGFKSVKFGITHGPEILKSVSKNKKFINAGVKDVFESGVEALKGLPDAQKEIKTGFSPIDKFTEITTKGLGGAGKLIIKGTGGVVGITVKGAEVAAPVAGEAALVGIRVIKKIPEIVDGGLNILDFITKYPVIIAGVVAYVVLK